MNAETGEQLCDRLLRHAALDTRNTGRLQENGFHPPGSSTDEVGWLTSTQATPTMSWRSRRVANRKVQALLARAGRLKPD